jgi:hypothetical protein
MQVYWTNIFILPKRVIRTIEKMLSRFLCNGKIDGIAWAKVTWKDVCVPKNEGGLGLRRLDDWNLATILRPIWALFASLGFIWVVWVKLNYLLKGRCFWNLKIPWDCTWCWRKLLKRHY